MTADSSLRRVFSGNIAATELPLEKLNQTLRWLQRWDYRPVDLCTSLFQYEQRLNPAEKMQLARYLLAPGPEFGSCAITPGQGHLPDTTPYSGAVILVHGPSASGKSTAAKQLQKDLGGEDKTIIISRDVFLSQMTAIYNSQKRTNYTVNDILSLSTPLTQEEGLQLKRDIEKSADKLMAMTAQTAWSEGKIVIWDTMQAFKQYAPDLLVCRINTRCLDDPDRRNWSALAERHGMNPETQYKLGTLKFLEQNLTSQHESRQDPATPVLNSMILWSSQPGHEPTQIMVDECLLLCKQVQGEIKKAPLSQGLD